MFKILCCIQFFATKLQFMTFFLFYPFSTNSLLGISRVLQSNFAGICRVESGFRIRILWDQCDFAWPWSVKNQSSGSHIRSSFWQFKRKKLIGKYYVISTSFDQTLRFLDCILFLKYFRTQKNLNSDPDSCEITRIRNLVCNYWGLWGVMKSNDLYIFSSPDISLNVQPRHITECSGQIGDFTAKLFSHLC